MATANIGNNISEEEMKSLYCSITGQLMEDPVISTDDSFTYERSAIVAWLSRPGFQPTSPNTRQPMNIRNLFPNRPLKNFIEAYKKSEAYKNALNGSNLVANPSMVTTPSIVATPNISIKGKLTSPTELYIALEALNEAIETNIVPTDIIYVLDVSGSMHTVASKESEEGESDFLSRLDLAKYSILSGIMSLGPNDRACIITFSDAITNVMPLTYMSDINKQQTARILNLVKAGGCTDIWGAIKEGIKVIKGITDNTRNIDVQFLTDGEPSSQPEGGIAVAFKEHLAKLQLQQSFTFNMIGFGYALKPTLLDDIAKVGSALIRHIPDCSMIASTFVNLNAIIKSTCLSNSFLKITSDGKDIGTKLNHYNNNVGSILLGQKRELLFQIPPFTGSANIKIELKVGTRIIASKDIVVDSSQFEPEIPTQIRYKLFTIFTKCLKDNMKELNLSYTKQQFDEVYSEIQRLLNAGILTDNDKLCLENYLFDYKSDDCFSGGQSGLAIQRVDWYNKWGASCLYSMASSYYYQQCTNFKDRGIMNFKTPLFEIYKEKANDIFDSLPPPTPTSDEYQRKATQANHTGRSVSPVVMSQYNNRGSSCFSGDGLVKLPNNMTCRVDCLIPGQIVKTLNGTTKIKYILKTRIKSGKTFACIFDDNLVIHPYHPVKVDGKWTMPNMIVEQCLVDMDYWYNIVLENGHILYINETAVITLAHGFSDAVVFHPYYGTQLVIKDLELMDTNKDGYIVVENLVIQRKNDLVVKISNISV